MVATNLSQPLSSQSLIVFLQSRRIYQQSRKHTLLESALHVTNEALACAVICIRSQGTIFGDYKLLCN